MTLSLITVALAGNPNSGKTTAFNALTGAHQHVGNYPGVTVEKKEGMTRLADGTAVRLIDLPGTYSLSAYTPEESVARMVLAKERPDVVVDVLNAGALERNLYLSVQLLELGLPVALGLNMMDEAKEQGVVIDLEVLAARLGLPVLPTVARTGEGMRELLEAAAAFAETRRGQDWQPLRISYGPDLDPVLAEMEHAVQERALLAPDYPARWVALKFLEGDEEILTHSQEADPELAEELARRAREVTAHLRDTLATSAEAVIADYRYGYIASLLRGGALVRHDDIRARMHFSDKLDHALTHPLWGPLCMFGLLYLIYYITFTLGSVPMGWVEACFAWLRDIMDTALPAGALKSLLLSGIIDGVGGVMGFVPLIMLIFMQIAILEDSGYMARMAYMLDRVFRIFGLHGCSVMPFIVGGGIAGGCAVPGVLAARTLRSPREKLATLLTVPFMACGAKLPVFILFSGIFFPNHEAAVMFGLTLTGWGTALIMARVLRSTVIRGPSTPFVMELPPYRLPTVRGLLIHTLERTWAYLKKAGTVILAISVLLWAAMAYPKLSPGDAASFAGREQTLQAELAYASRTGGDSGALNHALLALEKERSEAELRQSFAGRLGIALEPYTRPAGFDWRMDIALIGGFAAKEVIVATLGTAYSLGDVNPDDARPLADQIRQDPSWTPATALGLLVFVLLYAPCFVTVAVIRQETGSWRWPLFSVVFSTLLAFGAAVAVRQTVELLLRL